MRFWTLGNERVSTEMGVHVPPASVISRATVEMVEVEELGSGGKGLHCEASDVDFADTTTAWVLAHSDIGWVI